METWENGFYREFYNGSKISGLMIYGLNQNCLDLGMKIKMNYVVYIIYLRAYVLIEM